MMTFLEERQVTGVVVDLRRGVMDRPHGGLDASLLAVGHPDERQICRVEAKLPDRDAPTTACHRLMGNQLLAPTSLVEIEAASAHWQKNLNNSDHPTATTF